MGRGHVFRDFGDRLLLRCRQRVRQFGQDSSAQPAVANRRATGGRRLCWRTKARGS